MTRGLKFRILEVEGVFNLCTENKSADQRLPRSLSAPLFVANSKNMLSHYSKNVPFLGVVLNHKMINHCALLHTLSLSQT